MEKLIGARDFKDEGDRELSRGQGGRLFAIKRFFGAEFALSSISVS
jgi:hypothetical protein